MDMTLRLIELGSRAVRVLIVTRDRKGEMRVVHSDSGKFPSWNLAALPAQDFPAALLRLRTVMEGLRSRSSQLKIERELVFGTAALRELDGARRSMIAEMVGRVAILQRRQEAAAAFAAGVMGFPRYRGDRHGVAVLDQGGGSLEMSVGRVDMKGDIDIEEYRSYLLGSELLKTQLSTAGGGIDAFRRALKRRIAGYRMPEHISDRQIVGMGTPVANAAWLRVRADLHERYDPMRIHGIEIQKSEMESLVARISADPEGLQRELDPGRIQDGVQFVVAAGLVAIIQLLTSMGADRLTVSGIGLRYGLAWLLIQDSKALGQLRAA